MAFGGIREEVSRGVEGAPGFRHLIPKTWVGRYPVLPTGREAVPGEVREDDAADEDAQDARHLKHLRRGVAVAPVCGGVWLRGY